MKKLLLVVSLLALVGLNACGSGGGSAVTPVSTESAVASSAAIDAGSGTFLAVAENSLSVVEGSDNSYGYSVTGIIFRIVFEELYGTETLTGASTKSQGPSFATSTVDIAGTYDLDPTDPTRGTVTFPTGSNVTINVSGSTIRITGTVTGTVADAAESVELELITYNEVVAGPIRVVLNATLTVTSSDPFLATLGGTVGVSAPSGLTITGDVEGAVDSMSITGTLSGDTDNLTVTCSGTAHVTVTGSEQEVCTINTDCAGCQS